MNADPNETLIRKLGNFEPAVAALSVSVATPVAEPRDVSGIIKDFELAYELSWKTLKAFLASKGEQSGAPKDVLSKAYRDGYLDDEQAWLAMIDDRNLSVHGAKAAAARRARRAQGQADRPGYASDQLATPAHRFWLQSPRLPTA